MPATNGPSAVVHNFARSLKLSTDLNGEVDWVALYRGLWPDMIAAVRVDRDCELQRRGVDRIIHMPDGRQFTVDEKLRLPRKNGEKYDDFLLEEYSDLARKTPGWTLDPRKICDYVAYAITYLGKCYLLPFEILRLTCTTLLEDWKQTRRARGPKDVQNTSWVTRNWAVHWVVLFDALQRQMTLKFGGKIDVKLPVPKAQHQQFTFDWDAANHDDHREEYEGEIPF